MADEKSLSVNCWKEIREAIHKDGFRPGDDLMILSESTSCDQDGFIFADNEMSKNRALNILEVAVDALKDLK